MPKTIRAVFENGLFRPTEPVDLPDPCEVEVEVRAVNQGSGTAATWDDIFATKLVINSAPPDPKDDDGELTGDDFLY